MKKRLILFIVMVMIFATATGCGSRKPENNVEPDVKQQDKNADTGKEISLKENPDTKVAESEDSGISRERILACDNGIYVINDEKIPVPIYTAEADKTDIRCVDTYKDRLFFKVYEYNEDEGRSLIRVVNPDGGVKDYEIPEEFSSGFKPCGIYEGKYRFTYYQNYSEPAKCGYFDCETLDFWEDTNMRALYDAIPEEYIPANEYNAILTDIARYGELYMYSPDEKLLLVLDAKGNEKKRYNYTADIKNFLCYDGRYAIGANYIDDENNIGEENIQVIIIDTENGDEHELAYYPADESRHYFICPNGMPAFSSVNEWGSADVDMHISLLEKGSEGYDEAYVISAHRSPASVDTNTEGRMGVAIALEEDIYYLEQHNGDMVWMRKSLTDLQSGAVNTDCVSAHIGLYDFGTLLWSGRTYSENGRNYMRYNDVELRLNDEYSGAGVMNAELDRMQQEFMDGIKDVQQMSYTELFDPRNAEYSMYITAYETERRFIEATQIGSRYIQLTYNNYDYFGGAHGMYSMEYDLFDMETGDLLTIGDFYEGTLDEFKSLVASYSLADYNSEEGREKYYGDDSDAQMYQQFYEYTDFERTVRFDKEGFYICYPPYEFGPYASGYIEVYIPYKDAGIDISQ